MTNSSNTTEEPYIYRDYKCINVTWEVRVPYLFTDEDGATAKRYFTYRETVTSKDIPDSVKIKRDEFLLDPRCLA